MLVALNSQQSNTSLTFVDVRKQLNTQEAFSSEQTHNKTENANLCSGAPCPTDYPLRSVSGRFGSAVVKRDCSCVEALSHLLDARQRARVFETLPTKTELWLWL